MTTDHTTPDKTHIKILNEMVNGKNLEQEIRDILGCLWCREMEELAAFIERKGKEAKIEILREILSGPAWRTEDKIAELEGEPSLGNNAEPIKNYPEDDPREER